MSYKLVYHYTFIHGGLADFIKFFIHTIYLCKKYHLDLFVYIDHPIQEYIEWNNHFKHKILSSLPTQSYTIGNKFRGNLFQNILKTTPDDSYIIINSLDFFSYDIQFHIPVELNFHENHSNDFHLQNYFSFRMPDTMTIPHKSYTCIHIRMGDKYSNIKPCVEYCDQDDRSVEHSKIIEHVSNIINMTDEHEDIYFMSDNDEIIENMIHHFSSQLKRTTISNIRLNISYPIDDMNLFQFGLENTIYEFEFLRNATSIYSLSYSGFTVMANYVKVNPSQQLFKLYPIHSKFV